MKNLIASVLLLAVVAMEAQSSAIPMWEYLSKPEKMSHLYSMFAKQVQTFCKTTTSELSKAQCKRDLLMYGLGKLNDMNEQHLDTMDPYQRGAHSLIWDSMMDGHSSTSTGANINTGAAPSTASSGQAIKAEEPQYHQYQDPPMQHYEQYVPQKKVDNPLFSDKEASYANNMEDQSYNDKQNNYLSNEATNVNYNYALINKPNDLYQQQPLEQSTNYLTGPMVVRVKMDGTPVDEKRPLPKDDDEMQIGRERLPTMDQLRGHIMQEEGPKIIIQTPPTYTQTYQPIQRSQQYQQYTQNPSGLYPAYSNYANLRNAAYQSSQYKPAKTLYSNFRIAERGHSNHY